jgi:hypothetical protein
MAFIFRGKKYENLASIAEGYDIPLDVFRVRLDAGLTLGLVVDLPVAKRGEQMIYKGRSFENCKDVVDYFDWDYDWTLNKLQKNWRIKDMVELLEDTGDSILDRIMSKRDIVELSDETKIF